MLPDDPVVYAAVVLAVAAVLQYQRTLSWTEYKQLHRLKCRVLPLVDRATNLFVVSAKGAPGDDAEHLCDSPDSVREVFRALVEAGGSPHLVNSIKRLPDGRLSAAHVVFSHADGTQTEAYLFRAPALNGGTHIYCHHEPGVVNADEHLDGSQQTDGDPRGVVQPVVCDPDD